MNNRKSPASTARMAAILATEIINILDINTGVRRLIRNLDKVADRESCTSCGTRIPPGRAGRRCESCRKSSQ